MEIKEWRSLAIQSVSLFLAVFVCCICLSGRLQEKPATTVMAEEISRQESDAESEEIQTEVVQTVENATKSQVETRSGTYIRISKDGIENVSEVSISNEYMESKITVTFRGAAAGSITKNSVIRVHGFQVNKGKLTKQDKFLKKLTIDDRENASAAKNAIKIEMVTKKIYEPALYEADDAYYISLAEPEKLFDRIVVIDAGHGGEDEGTSSQDGKYMEKDYALLVVKRLKKILEQENEDIKVYYTRLEDEEVSKKDRTSFANRLHADLFISIHCNASSVGDTTAYGIESLYSKRKAEYGNITNKHLAQIMLTSLGEKTGLRERNIIQREQLYLLHHAKVPTTIVEIGYMSNKSDLKFIKKENGQQKLAEGIRDGILRALEEE